MAFLLATNVFQKVIYNEKETLQVLDPNHTHYIFVESKSKDEFLPVIELKSRVELYLGKIMWHIMIFDLK